MGPTLPPVVEPRGEHLLRASASMMRRSSTRQEYRRESGSASSHRKVQLLEIDEEPLVKAAQILEEPSPHKKKGSAHLVDFLSTPVLRLIQVMAGKPCRQEPIESERPRGDMLPFGESSTAGVNIALVIDELDA